MLHCDTVADWQCHSAVCREKEKFLEQEKTII